MTTRTRLTRRLMSLLALAPVCFLGTMVATAAQAGENYALIVAASDYPNLDQKYWLKGPKNDEALIRDYLLNSAPVKFAPQNVVALGTGDGLQLGTHQAILDNMARIAETAKPGDFVYLHFSGHGTQQPAIDDTTEPDGRDEVFLPADTRMAPPDNPKFYPNALTDDEMSGALKAIRKTGAFVWIVFDSCFSGTMTRGAPGDVLAMDRKIDPADLGIPDSAFAQPAALDVAESSDRAIPMAAASADGDEADLGGMVAFFAATSEPTQEHGFPADVGGPVSGPRKDTEPGEGRTHGLPPHDGGIECDPGLREDLVDLGLCRRRVVRIALVELVGRPEQEHPLPGDGEGDADAVVRDDQGRRPGPVEGEERVHSLAEPAGGLRTGILEPPHAVDPRSRRVHDRARLDLDAFDAELVAD